MPRYSAFTAYGHLRYARRKSTPETIYRSISNNLGGTFDMAVGGLHEALVYSAAYGYARQQNAIERAANEANPKLARSTLRAQERAYQIVPPLGASLASRRDALYAASNLGNGATRSAIEDGLVSLLGDDFICYRTTHTSELTTYPANPEDGPGLFVRNDTVARTFKFLGNVTVLNTPTMFGYEAYSGVDDGSRLFVGDVITVQSENEGLGEKVTVTAVTEVPGSLFATVAGFTKVKETGASICTGPVPYWVSNQRADLIIVTAAAAVDPESRRKINTFMQSPARATATWFIVAAYDATTTVEFTVDTPLGSGTLAAMSYP